MNEACRQKIYHSESSLMIESTIENFAVDPSPPLCVPNMLFELGSDWQVNACIDYDQNEMVY